jgi:hypothetical protein
LINNIQVRVGFIGYKDTEFRMLRQLCRVSYTGKLVDKQGRVLIATPPTLSNFVPASF